MNFWTSAGFGGLAAVVAAVLAFTGLMVRLRSDRLEDGRVRDQAVYAARDEDARTRWWQAVNWVWDNRNNLDESTKIALLTARPACQDRHPSRILEVSTGGIAPVGEGIMSAHRASNGWDEAFPDSGLIIMKPDREKVLLATVYGTGGDKLGTVRDVYFDDFTGDPTWLTVQTGLSGTKESLIPITNAVESSRGNHTVPYSKDQVQNAPQVGVMGGHLSQDEEAELYRYYGIEGVTSDEAVTRWEHQLKGRTNTREQAAKRRRWMNAMARRRRARAKAITTVKVGEVEVVVKDPFAVARVAAGLALFPRGGLDGGREGDALPVQHEDDALRALDELIDARAAEVAGVHGL